MVNPETTICKGCGLPARADGTCWRDGEAPRVGCHLHGGPSKPADAGLPPLESAFPDAYSAAKYLSRRAFYVQATVALLREARNSRAADILPDGWSDRVDAVLQEMDRG